MLTRRALILAKEEVTYGTDPTPAAADNAVMAINPVIRPVGDKLTRDIVRTTLSSPSPLLGKRYVEFTFTTELRGSGAAGTAPRGIGDLFEACGMLETIVVSTSVKYTPASSSLKSCTIYAYFDGLLHKITGAVGTWEIVNEAGQTSKINWTFRGLYAAPTDTALPGSITYDATIPPVVLSAGFKLNAITTLVAQQVAIALNASIGLRDDVNAATSVKGFVITGRAAAGSFNPEAVTVATYDFHADWTAATARALEITIGSAAGNICKQSAPKVTLDSIGAGDRDGVRVFDIPVSLGYNTGDDECEILFT